MRAATRVVGVSRRRGFARGDRREVGAGRRGGGKARDVARAGFHALLSLCASERLID